MARGKKHTAKQIVNLLRQVGVGVGNGRTLPQACRRSGWLDGGCADAPREREQADHRDDVIGPVEPVALTTPFRVCVANRRLGVVN